MANLLFLWAPFVRAEGVVRAPYGDAHSQGMPPEAVDWLLTAPPAKAVVGPDADFT